ncbi:acyl carrier protein [Methylorubrum salsuginis]|uniref:Acyl carrier protein n=1 Tax=Methylorubrum salsuginis TaxID=414703 RepID=A0A1I4FHJ9_9HYPH|nr:acyl carrier protein [Methylorubrum salsuginis]SFL17398.1 acyl carrier protein [Methylorubrum salsuginis]
MTPDEIDARLTDIFREVFDDPALVLRPEMTARDVAGWDSGRMVDILMATEEAFGITFTTREVDALARVGDLAETVARKLAGG